MALHQTVLDLDPYDPDRIEESFVPQSPDLLSTDGNEDADDTRGSPTFLPITPERRPVRSLLSSFEGAADQVDLGNQLPRWALSSGYRHSSSSSGSRHSRHSSSSSDSRHSSSSSDSRHSRHSSSSSGSEERPPLSYTPLSSRPSTSLTNTPPSDSH